MSKKESALDLAKFIDKGVRVKLAGGREGKHTCSSNMRVALQPYRIHLLLHPLHDHGPVLQMCIATVM
jgi:hypothetical protein